MLINEEKIVYIFTHVLRDGKIFRVKGEYSYEFGCIDMPKRIKGKINKTYYKGQYSTNYKEAFEKAQKKLEKEIQITGRKLKKLKEMKIILEDLL